MEWMFSLCLPVSRISIVQRKSNLRGKRIITITRTGGSIECPLIFQDGGMTRFFDALKKVANVTPSPAQPDEFFVEERIGGGSPMPFVKAISSPGPGDPDELGKDLYGERRAERKKGVMNSIMTFGASLTQRGTKLAGSMLSLAQGSPTTQSETPDSYASDDFDIVQPIVSVEHMVPVISNKTSRRMGPSLSKEDWLECFNSEGRLNLEFYAAARVKMFYGAISDPLIRVEVWSFLLGVYPLTSSSAERAAIDEIHRREYEVLSTQWKTVFPEQARNFSAFRERKQAIEKDVCRTDRTLPDLIDDHSPKLQSLHDILMAYMMFNFDLGYCQGMSDILAVPLLLPGVHSDSHGFAMFKQIMTTKTEGNFRHDVKANMEQQMRAIQLITKQFIPALYSHLEKHHAEDMTFCFRWLLILFKREFERDDLLLLWDVILASPYTPQFEIIVAVALLKAISPQVVEQSLSYDELLKFTNSVSGNISAVDCIVLTHEFYDLVSSHVAWTNRGALKAGATQESLMRPTLQDILSAIQDSPPEAGVSLVGAKKSR
jgi:hypothetical protein